MTPWLEPTWQRILQAYSHNKMPHALLLVGSAGIGKEELAKTAAGYLLCQAPTSTGPCHHCRACYLNAQQSHPDLRDLGGTEGIGIDDIRDMTEFLTQTAFGQRKVVVLRNADLLNLNAANALLKTLEEPPGESQLILLAERATAVLPTIKSRCVVMNIPLPSRELALHWLQAGNPNSSQAALHEALSLAGGAPFKAQEYLHNPALKEAQQAWELAMFSAQEADVNRVQQLIAAQPQEALYSLYYWLTEFIRYSLQCSTEFMCKPTEEKRWQDKAARLTLQQSFRFLEKVNEAMRAFTFPGTNKSLIMDALFYEWHHGLMEN